MSWIKSERMFFSVEEVAERAGIPLSTLKHQIHYQKRVRPLKLGKTLVFSKAQMDEIVEQGWTELEVDASAIFTNKQAVEYLRELGLNINYSALVFARDSGALPYERVGGTEDRAARLLFHKVDLVVFAAERGAPDFIPEARSFFSPIEAEEYTVGLGERIPRPTLLYNARVGRIHPIEVEGVDVFSAEQLRDFLDSSAGDRRSDLKIDRSRLMTIAEAAEHLGLDEQQEVKYQMFHHRMLPYEPVGVSSKGVQLFLLRRVDVEALEKGLEK